MCEIPYTSLFDADKEFNEAAIVCDTKRLNTLPHLAVQPVLHSSFALAPLVFNQHRQVVILTELRGINFGMVK